jgi:hypothetical protein
MNVKGGQSQEESKREGRGNERILRREEIEIYCTYMLRENMKPTKHH